MRASVCVEVGSRNRENVGSGPGKNETGPKNEGCLGVLRMHDNDANY